MDTVFHYYVYHDRNYGFSWISEDCAGKIVEFFTSKEFKEIDTMKLVEVMKEGISKSDTCITIVFSHDIIPDKLLDNVSSPSPNSLFRRFLNAGHTIVWLGDIPTWYVGLPGKIKRPLPQPLSIRNLLGIEPPTRLTNEAVLVKPTLEGIMLGLKPWKGRRPHRPQPQMLPLAMSREGVHGYICSPRYSPRTLSGLVRLYDLGPITPDVLTDDMLEAILNIALRKILRHELIMLNRKINMLISEIDEKLMKKLDIILEEIKKLKP